MFKSPVVRITFRQDGADLWDVKWPMVPRLGEIVALPQGRVRVEEVIWEMLQDRPEVVLEVRPLEDDAP